MNPKVSVMVMIYNAERHLRACLDSLKNQTFTDFEVLMVEDASTDHSLEICQEYSNNDERFRIIHFDTNKGMSQSRAVTLEEAAAEYVAILDADDLALPRRLERQVEWLDVHRDVVLVGAFYYVVNDSGTMLHMERPPLCDEDIRWELTFGNCLGHLTVMYRKAEAIRCGGYNPLILAGEDMDFYSRIMALGKMAVIPEPLSSWRSHESNRSKTEPIENKLQFITTVRNSISRHAGVEVPLDVAAALFNNSGATATSAEVFIQALKVTLFAAAGRMNQMAAEKEKRQLAKRAYSQLMNLYNRNSVAPWWRQVSNAWTKCVLEISQSN